ncbi:MAG TPA: LuxR family transcriptional regulator [Bryobacteraceae bacterium]|nr:LuxR family transcriptional regulator [Bryobacteraceae bacterium]
MIRIIIVAENPTHGEALAKLLADDERLDIVEMGTPARWRGREPSIAADVLVAVNIRSDDLPNDGPPAVVLTDRDPLGMPLQGSIRAWLPRNALPAEIAAAISAAACDLTCLTQAQARRWLQPASIDRDEEPALLETLTPRELQVLRMLADGLGNKEIADRLGISDHTAKFHVAQILAKLGAGSRAEAVAIGIRRGLVPI